MKSIKDMSLLELGSFICSALKVEDIHVVLSGGSCVEIYSRGEYTSWDLDLINQYNEQFKKIHVIMNTLGFKERDRYFVHEDTKYFIEFPLYKANFFISDIKMLYFNFNYSLLFLIF